jgi:hypothetical protein
MSFSGIKLAQQCRLLVELVRILELRIDAKRREVDEYRESQRICERELMEQQGICDIAENVLEACSISITKARVVAFVPGTMPGFMASQKRLLKIVQKRRNEVKAASERLDEAESLVVQSLEALAWLRSRHQLLENLLQTLQRQAAIHNNLLEDTLQDDDYTSYLSSKMHRNLRSDTEHAAHT